MRLERSLLVCIAALVLAGFPSANAEACPSRIQTRHLGHHAYPRENIVVRQQADHDDGYLWLNIAGLVALAGLLGLRRDYGIGIA